MKKKKILKYDIEGNFIEIFESIRSASDSVNIKSHSNILACCNQKSNSVGGFQWKFYVDGFLEKIDPAVRRGEIFKQKYGINSENHSELVQKIKDTNISKFGVDHHMKDKESIQNYKDSCLKIYGTDNPAKNQNVKDKISKTERERKTKSYFLDKLDFNIFELISINTEDIVQLYSKQCTHSFEINRQLLTVRTKAHHEICTICNDPKNNQVSEIENYLYEKFQKLGILVERNVVGLAGNREEIDLFFPQNKFGVEINGIKYHSEEFGKGQFHHISKTKRFQQKNIGIYHFFDDEINDKTNIVLSMIKSKLNLNNRIFARKCRIEKITNIESISFLKENHLQGPVNSIFSFGLFYNDCLVSIMTFGSLRKVLGSKSVENTYELLRFCNKTNTNVIGAASKLLHYFIKEVKPKKIISYANLRWSTGNLYRKIGFTDESEVKPGYYIFYKNKRYNRYKFRKSELIEMGYSKDKTSNDILAEMGAFKLWDCGNIKFEMNL